MEARGDKWKEYAVSKGNLKKKGGGGVVVVKIDETNGEVIHTR